MTVKPKSEHELVAVRVDKWLWAARFFKTRSLAAQAVSGGKIHVNGVRVKPARVIGTGELLAITKGELAFEVVVMALSMQRGPAPQAQLLYAETPASVERRTAAAAARKAENEERTMGAGRPTTRDRRTLADLKRID
jgi:ribosome-associated heat shock protein Hsp15